MTAPKTNRGVGRVSTWIINGTPCSAPSIAHVLEIAAEAIRLSGPSDKLLVIRTQFHIGGPKQDAGEYTEAVMELIDEGELFQRLKQGWACAVMNMKPKAVAA